MPLLQLCKQLERIRQSVETDDALLAYRLERIRQNIRLDFPGIQLASGFSDLNPYPDRYPEKRGPFVTPARQDLFVGTLDRDQLDRLDDVVRQIETAGTRVERVSLWERYTGLLSQLEWVKPEAMEDVCNQENRLQAPQKLCRYMALSGFLYALLKQDRSRSWTNDEIRNLARELKREITRPSKGWAEFARVWNGLRADIRSGFSFDIRPQRPHGVWFWTDGEQPVHTPGATPTPDSALKIIRDLGLPGWETPDLRLLRLGIVAIWIDNNPLCTYRPTLLDQLGNGCYFFLPGSRVQGVGLTWPLTKCCRYNDFDNQSGFKEWTAAMPANGIPASLVSTHNPTPAPAFELAGLFFGPTHAGLFAT